jgi:hypothetical protein
MATSRDTYAQKYGIRLVDALGHGKDGDVLKTELGQAVKFFHDRDVYARELRAYRVLTHRNIDEIDGHQIPRLVRSDDEFLAIEMTIVVPPYLLDFAACYSAAEVDRFAFTADVLDERQQHWAEVFGERWPAVVGLKERFFRLTGLMLLDLSLNNVRFE